MLSQKGSTIDNYLTISKNLTPIKDTKAVTPEI